MLRVYEHMCRFVSLSDCVLISLNLSIFQWKFYNERGLCLLFSNKFSTTIQIFRSKNANGRNIWSSFGSDFSSSSSSSSNSSYFFPSLLLLLLFLKYWEAFSAKGFTLIQQFQKVCKRLHLKCMLNGVWMGRLKFFSQCERDFDPYTIFGCKYITVNSMWEMQQFYCSILQLVYLFAFRWCTA